MKQLTAYFSSKGITGDELVQIIDAFSQKLMVKGDHFIEEGKISRHLAFITKGLFQYYYLKDGKEITTYVAGENNFLASVASFFQQRPSKEYIRALTDAELWMISYNDLTNLKKESNAFRTFYIDAMESLVVAMDDTRSNLITLSAEERYTLLLKEEPALLQQVPLQYLASILGVTPRHLSRIRNNIT